MNTAGVHDVLKQLGGNLSDLEENLQPLLTSALSETTKKLPLLDRAKLYTTIVYAIESLLFSYLRLQGVNAKEHDVYKELNRVRQYFAKITEAENGSNSSKRDNMTLNKQAAGRMIKHALAPNKKFDAELAARKANELAIAKKKLQEMEERRSRRLRQQSSSEGQATPTASEVNAQSEVDASLVASALAQVQEEVEAKAEADAAADATDSSLLEIQTPESAALSELTDSSRITPRKGKKKRKHEQLADTPSAKKKRKHNQSGSATS